MKTNKIVVISGHICTGKSELRKNLGEQFGFRPVKTSSIIRKLFDKDGESADRIKLQKLGEQLDRDTDGAWLALEVQALLSQHGNGINIVIDAVRTPIQVDRLREVFGVLVVHVHLTASDDELRRRFDERVKTGREQNQHLTFESADLYRSEDEISHLQRQADLSIDVGRSVAKDTLVRVASRLGLYAPPDLRCVDVLVGGEYGSEGKGQVAAYIARNYDVLVRVGGPNAGHKVKSASGEYTYHHLPSGCKDASAEIIIGPGAVVNPEDLVKEITECELGPDRVFIDEQVMVITEDDIRNEGNLKRDISSTGSGAGWASARKINGRGRTDTILARDHALLKPYVCKTYERLEKAYAEGKKVFLEGTQGSALSLHHGLYPYVTSRDTNVAGCLAEAGISPSRVRRIILVVRTYPIRVANPEGEGKTSGAMKHEISFKEIADRAGLDPDELKRAEVTSTTKRDRRVAEFDWEIFRRACALNAPTDVALTFADYIDGENRKAQRFEQLSEDTIRFIEEIERVAHAPVSLISTRFGDRAVIDRRDWW